MPSSIGPSDEYTSHHYYNVTLHRPSIAQSTVKGRFIDRNRPTEELVVIRGYWIEIWGFDPESDTKLLSLLYRTADFAHLSTMQHLAIPGIDRDYLVFGSDSGVLTLVCWDPTANDGKGALIAELESPHSRSGKRRTTVGHYVGVDPHGRAILLAAVEKTKHSYIVNNDGEGHAAINSPIDISSPNVVCYGLIGLDTGLEFPMFASLETVGNAPENRSPKAVVLYEVDLGLNVLHKRQVFPVIYSTAMMLALPGGQNGPSGLLVVDDETITYHHTQDPAIVATFPRRIGQCEDAPPLLIASTVVKREDGLFALVQNEVGDIFKVHVATQAAPATRWGGQQTVTALNIEFFSWAPPASKLEVIDETYMYVAAMNDDHRVISLDFTPTEDGYQDTEDDPIYADWRVQEAPPLDIIPGLAPITTAKFTNPKEESAPRVYSGSGNKGTANLSVLQYGMNVTQLIESPLPGDPELIFTGRTTSDADEDTYIIFAFSDTSLVLSNGLTVSEVEDSGFDTSWNTLAVHEWPNALVQVFPRGLRHIAPDKTVTSWSPEDDAIEVCACAINASQLLLALTDNTLVYFELSEENVPQEYDVHPQLSERVEHIALPTLLPDQERCSYAALATKDKAIRIYSLEPERFIEPVALHTQEERVSALAMTLHDDYSVLTLHVGFHSGLYTTIDIDDVSGDFGKSFSRFLGPETVSFADTWPDENGDEKVLVLTKSKTWLSSPKPMGFFEAVPLLYPGLTSATKFITARAQRAYIAIRNGSLVVFQIDDNAKELMHRKKLDMPATVQAIADNEFSKFVYVLCSEHGYEFNPNHKVGATPSLQAVKSSIVTMTGSKNPEVVNVLELPERSEALNVVNVEFSSVLKHFLAVSMVNGVSYESSLPGEPIRSYESASLRIYDYTGRPIGSELELVHETSIPQAAKAMLMFDFRLLVGIGNELAMFEIGRNQLLKKTSIIVPHFQEITTIVASKDRVFAGDSTGSIACCFYISESEELFLIADHSVPRCITAMHVLDPKQVMVADKIGNVCIFEVPYEADELMKCPEFNLFYDAMPRRLNGLPFKFVEASSFYAMDTIKAFFDGPLVLGGYNSVGYCGFQGTIGAFIPMRRDHYSQKTLADLEWSLAQDYKSITGRNPRSFRGYFEPAKRIIDGDLCEQYFDMGSTIETEIAAGLQTDPESLQRLLLEIRHSAAF